MHLGAENAVGDRKGNVPELRLPPRDTRGGGQRERVGWARRPARSGDLGW